MSVVHAEEPLTGNDSEKATSTATPALELNLDHDIVGKPDLPPPVRKPTFRIKLRMSRSIENFESLNDQTATSTNTVDDAYIDDATAKAGGAVIIEADKMEIYLDRSMKAIGNASLIEGNQTIQGDMIDFDKLSKELHVVGNAEIESQGNVVKGPELRLNMSDNTGDMKDATFTMAKQASKPKKNSSEVNKDYAYGQSNISNVNPVNDQTSDLEKSPKIPDENNESSDNQTSQKPAARGDAKDLFFEGESKKRLKDARYTTCSADSDDWYIKTGSLEIDDDTKTAVARNATVEFKNVPILYTPWINFPYANQRKSGLLAPTFGTTSRSGIELYEPFYWNIAPDMDATLGTRYLSKRGMQYLGQYRYLGERYGGIDALEYLPSDSSSGRSRFYYAFKHQQTFGNGWGFNFDVERVSDDQYFSDLSTHIITTSRVNLPQQLNIAYSNPTWQFNGLIQKFQTLDGISFPYERLPQLSLNGNKDWGIYNLDVKNQWTHFDIDPVAPQTFVTGNRFNTYPSISIPLAEPYGYFTPKIGMNYTSYNLNNIGTSGLPKTDTRSVPIFSLDSGLFFDRKIQVGSNSYTQTLEPRAFYVYIPYRDQSNLPVFDSAEADLNIGTLFLENRFTGTDRINNANQISLAMTSRLIDSTTGEQRLAATLGQRYYFTSEKVELPGILPNTSLSSDILAAVTAKLINKWNVDFAWEFNTNNGDIIRTNIGTRYNPEPGKVLNLSYRYTQNSLEQFNISGQWPLGQSWYGIGRYNYSIQDHQPIEAIAGIEYDAGCWQTRTVIQRVSTATATANYAIFIQLELGGLASIGSNPKTLINRAVPGYTSSGLLPENYRQEYNE